MTQRPVLRALLATTGVVLAVLGALGASTPPRLEAGASALGGAGYDVVQLGYALAWTSLVAGVAFLVAAALRPRCGR